MFFSLSLLAVVIFLPDVVVLGSRNLAKGPQSPNKKVSLMVLNTKGF
jgi:hypothetical protein